MMCCVALCNKWWNKESTLTGKFSIRHLQIYDNAPYFALALFLISLGTAAILRRNEKQRFCNFLFFLEGGGAGGIMADVQVANCKTQIYIMSYRTTGISQISKPSEQYNGPRSIY